MSPLRDREQYEKKLKKISLRTFQAGLNRHGYRIYSSNAFIAEGGFGIVLKIHNSHGQKFACKVISNVWFDLKSDRGNFTTKKMITRFANEVEIMKAVRNHPNIIQYVTSFNDQMVQRVDSKSRLTNASGDWNNQIEFNNSFIVMEYADAKTVSQYIKIRRRLSEDLTQEIFREVISAVEYLHRMCIVHRDIKLSNLLLHRKNYRTLPGRFPFTVKLCDFGLSSKVLLHNESHFTKPVGTAFYMSPEILRSYYFYNKRLIEMVIPYCAYKGDIWALGVCLYFCLHGYYPLEIVCRPNKAQRLAALGRIFDVKSYMMGTEATRCFNQRFQSILRKFHYRLSYSCKDLLSRMLEVVPEDRLDIESIAKHDYFW